MTKETRIPETRIGLSEAVVVNLVFGFWHSFDIRHSGFVIFRLLPGNSLVSACKLFMLFPNDDPETSPAAARRCHRSDFTSEHAVADGENRKGSVLPRSTRLPGQVR